MAYLRRVPDDVGAIRAVGTAIGPNDDPVNRAWGDRLVDDVLRIPYRWVGRLLIAQFGLWVVAAATGRPAEKVALLPSALGLPKGRLPRLDGRQITEGIHWYYRRDVQADPVDESVLVKEYLRARKDAGVYLNPKNHSVVPNRIDQVKVLLSLIQCLDGPRQIPGAQSTPT